MTQAPPQPANTAVSAAATSPRNLSVAVCYNPRAGRGRSSARASELSWALRGAGHQPRLIEVGPGLPSPDLEGIDALVVIGGDGTINHLLSAASRAGVPIYHAPTGTENLLARELGHDTDPQAIAKAISKGQSRVVDLARVTTAAASRLVSVMLSVGPDAAVTQRVAILRSAPGREGRSGGRFDFVQPTIREVFRPTLPPLTVFADDREIVTQQTGLLIVANCRRYALGINPAHAADMSDGLLDVAFFPCASSLGAALWLARCWAGLGRKHPRAIHARAKAVRIDSSTDSPPAQIDGESLIVSGRRLEVVAVPAVLSVVVP